MAGVPASLPATLLQRSANEATEPAETRAAALDTDYAHVTI
jgi:hypothetical protein